MPWHSNDLNSIDFDTVNLKYMKNLGIFIEWNCNLGDRTCNTEEEPCSIWIFVGRAGTIWFSPQVELNINHIIRSSLFDTWLEEKWIEMG